MKVRERGDRYRSSDKVSSLEFDDVYNCHCTLRLNAGRKIVLDKFTQSRTYAGLLEGTPSKMSNDQTIKRDVDKIARDPTCLGRPYFIEPERRSYSREPGDMQFIIDRRRGLPDELIPEWLPRILCVGDFRSLYPVRDETKDGSSLVIIWYQDDFGFDALAVDRLRMVNWERHATDWEY